MDARRLNFVLAAVALVAVGAAVTLALRPKAPGALPPPPAAAQPDDPEVTEHAPGGPNAIAARALESGGPRTPTVAGDGPKRGLANFSLSLDAHAPDAVRNCIREAGDVALARLDGPGSEDAPCSGAGPDHLQGRVRFTTRRVGSADDGLTCDASVSFTFTAADGRTLRQELRGDPARGDPALSCEKSLRSVEDTLLARISGP